MAKKLLTIAMASLLAAFVPRPARAEVDLSFGVRGGACWPNISWGWNPEYEESTRSATVGVFAELAFHPAFVIQPELDLVRMSFAWWDLYDFPPAKVVCVFDYLQIPVLLKARLVPRGKLSPVVAAGPVLGLLLRARARLYDVEGAFVDEADIKSSYRSIDLGAILAAGLEVVAGRMKLSADVRYYQGFSDIDVSPLYNMKNAGLMVTGGIAF